MATIHYDEPKNWIELFKQGRLHVVCVASEGLTNCDFLAITVGNMHHQEVRRLTKHVNREGETGTFSPRYPLTVLPQFEWEGRSALDDLERFLRKSFSDVAEANRLHVKLPDVLLDLNPYSGNYDIVTALPIAREVLSKEKSISNLWVMPTLWVERETSVIGRSRQESIEPQMVILPRGQFVMGSPQGELGHFDSESPQHTVQIPYALAVGKYPITFDQWDACVKDGGTQYSPSDQGWGRGSRPVINVSWKDIQLYLSWLSKVTGKTYRLLSEAEWEYAARAGSQTAYSFGNDPKELDRYAWFYEEPRKKTQPVGEKLPNAFGLHDMHGNVNEWTEDCWNPNYTNAPTDGSAWTTGDCSQRVVRGGSWDFDPQILRAAFRFRKSTSLRSYSFGFRVARTD